MDEGKADRAMLSSWHGSVWPQRLGSTLGATTGNDCVRVQTLAPDTTICLVSFAIVLETEFLGSCVVRNDIAKYLIQASSKNFC